MISEMWNRWMGDINTWETEARRLDDAQLMAMAKTFKRNRIMAMVMAIIMLLFTTVLILTATARLAHAERMIKCFGPWCTPCLPGDPYCQVLPPQGVPLPPLTRPQRAPPIEPQGMSESEHRDWVIQQGEEHCRRWPSDKICHALK